MQIPYLIQKLVILQLSKEISKNTVLILRSPKAHTPLLHGQSMKNSMKASKILVGEDFRVNDSFQDFENHEEGGSVH
jgi:hypothetical protein